MESEMIKIIKHMPVGTIGLEAVGKVTEDDYRDVLLPAVSAAVERNDVRLLYILGEDFESYSPGAMWADTKLWAQHPKAWKRIAIVSDADWLEHSVKAFGWLIPGEIKVFDTDDVDDAKEWLVGLDEDDD
jgi:SpoIIAA-like